MPSAETLTTRQFVALVYEVAGRPAQLRAVREQQYQRLAPWVVDHSKFERAFGARTTPHREAIRMTLDWFPGEAGAASRAG